MKKRIHILVVISLLIVLSAFISVRSVSADTNIRSKKSIDEISHFKISSIKAIKEKELEGCFFSETITEEEFRSYSKNNDISLFSSSNPTEDTGLYRSQLTGIAATIYDGIAEASLSASTPSLEVRFFEYGEPDDTFHPDEYYRIQDEVYSVYAKAMFAYMRDHGERLLWATNTVSCSVGVDLVSYYAVLRYKGSQFYTDSIQTNINSTLKSVKSGCTATSRKDKLLYYHDWLIDHCEYDNYALDVDLDTERDYRAHSAMGCLLDGRGVCESYAKAFKLFCYYENIPCVLVTGSNHMWNYVKMEDGVWYMIDCSNDDPEMCDGSVAPGYLHHIYFLISNNPYVSGHIEDDEYNYPQTATYPYDVNHNFTYTKTVAATCKSDGYKLYTCGHCNATYKETIPMDSSKHSWDTGVVTKAATERATGVRTYTCKVCAAKKTETIPKIQPLFDDVYKDSWYYTPVKWAVDHKITNGTSARTFSPDSSCTRAQIVTFLWNAAGCPSVSGVSNPFQDVKSTDWYYKPVLWAVSKRITNGTTATTFSPNSKCSRGQVVTFLWNWAGKPKTTNTIAFNDVKATDYYYSAVRWAAYKKVTNGTTATTFSPGKVCTRAEVVTFIYNYKTK